MDQVKKYYDDLLNLLDWGRASSFLGPISFASTVIFGFVSLFYGTTSFTVSLYSLLVGSLIGLWEFPSVYNICHGKEAGPLGVIDVEAIKSKLLEDYSMKKAKMRSILYSGLSLFLLWSDSGLCLYAGIILFLNSTCLMLSHLADARTEGMSQHQYSDVAAHPTSSSDEHSNAEFGGH